MELTLILMLILMFIIFATVSNAGWTYQEAENTSKCTGIWHATRTCAKAHDDDWATQGSPADIEFVTLKLNYSMTDGNGSNAKLYFVYYDGSAKFIENRSTSNCSGAVPLQVQFALDEGAGRTNVTCYSGTAWRTLFFDSIGATTYINDSGVYWNITAAEADTCTAPASGNWAVTASDNCNWNTNQNVPGNITTTGSGNLSLSANLTFTGSNQYIYLNPGVQLAILTGGAII